MRLYTRTGDTGETGLIGGTRVAKDSPRVGAYGEVDAANAAIGLALATECHGEVRAVLERVQADRVVRGADLAIPADADGGTPPRVTGEMFERLEKEIDRSAEALPPLHPF